MSVAVAVVVAPLVLDKLSVGCGNNKNSGGTSDMGDSGISSDPTSMTSPGSYYYHILLSSTEAFFLRFCKVFILKNRKDLKMISYLNCKYVCAFFMLQKAIAQRKFRIKLF